MRIAYICADPGIPLFGSKGASVHIQEIVRAFRGRGDDVTVYCTRRGNVVPADLADLRVVDMAVRAPDAANREIAIGATADLLAAAAIADGCDLVYERYSLFSAAAATVKEATGARVVLEVNAPLIDEQRAHRDLVDGARAVTDTQRVVRAADVVACVSGAVAQWIADLTAGDALGRIIVAPNGVNTHRITPATSETSAAPSTPKTAGPAAGALTIGFVGTLKPWHGVDVLLRAASVAASTAAMVDSPGPQWRLVIAGAGPQQNLLRDLARDLFATSPIQVEFTGAVAPDEIPSLLRSFDVAVAPYPQAPATDQYFSPLKVYEYLAAGLPIVASSTGQIPSIVHHGRNGLLVPPGDEAALAEALLTLHGDGTMRRRLGRAARDSAVRHHDWTAVLARELGALQLVTQ
jgi:starch synthase